MVKRRRTYGKGRSTKRRRFTGMRRKRYRSGFRARPSRQAFFNARSLMPTKLKRTFNYSEKISINAPTGGVSGAYIYSANSLYDPNRSGTGHQPIGFDEFVGVFYDHYVVIGAKINVVAMSQSNTTPDANCIVAIYVRDNAGTVGDITRVIEQGRCTYGMLGPADGKAGTLSLTHKVNPAKFLGRSKPLSDPDLKGSANGNPQEECYFEINVASIDGDDPPAVDMLVTIQYTAVLIERKPLGQS